MSELVQAARRELVAGQPDELVLAREVAVDRPDRQAALADDVRDGRAVVALLAEDAGRGGQDPVPDLLLVGGADTGHDRLPKRMDVHRNLAHGCAERNHLGLDKTNGHSLSSSGPTLSREELRCSAAGERSSTASADPSPSSPSSSRSPAPCSRRRPHRPCRQAAGSTPIPNRRPSRPASTPSSAPARARSSRSSARDARGRREVRRVPGRDQDRDRRVVDRARGHRHHRLRRDRRSALHQHGRGRRVHRRRAERHRRAVGRGRRPDPRGDRPAGRLHRRS